jgi:type II secretory pathway component PulC
MMTFHKILSIFRQNIPISSLITYTNWLLVVSLVWLSGSMTAKFIERSYLNVNLKDQKFISPKQNSRSKSQKLKNFETIIKNNIFNAEIESEALPVIEKAPEIVVPASGALKKILSELTLLGIYRGRIYYSIIKHNRTQKEDLFGINDKIFDTEAVVIKIYSGKTRQEIHIKLNDEVGVLKYEKDQKDVTQSQKISKKAVRKKSVAQKKQQKASQKNEVADPQTTNGTDFYLRAEEVEKHISNFPKLLNQAKVVPFIKNGKSEGYTIKYIDKGSLYEKLGLKNFDIIQKVNGEPIDSMEKAILLFKTLKNEREITINILRSSQPMSLSYHIN